MQNKVNLFLDSGAFSAKTKGIEINIQDYISFVKENEDYIDVYANLDVIGDAEATWKNQKIMEDAGLHPLPVFHIQDSMPYLYKCLDYKYFCLGGIAKGYSTQERRDWLDMCFNIICDSPDATPKNKVHGFGMTSLDLMIRYPWYSVDSTSWVLTGRFGAVLIPKKKNDKYIYDENPFKINVSNRSPDTKQEGQHFSTMTKMEQKIILEYLERKGFSIGKSEYRKENRKTYKLKENERWANSADADACRELIEEIGTFIPPDLLAMRDLVEIIIEPGLCNDYKKRDELNIIYFLDLENNLPKWPWPFKAKNKGGFGFK